MSQTSRQNQTQTGSGQFTQTTTPGTNTPDINRLREQKFGIDPSIGYRVGGALRRMKDQFNNPMGGYTTPQIRDATMRTQERSLLESGSQAMREGQHDVSQMEYGRNALLAGLTQPTSQSGTSSQQGTISGSASQPLLGSIIGAGAGVGAAAL